MTNRTTSTLMASLSVATIIGALSFPAQAQENQMSRPAPSISVTGEGEMSAAPDMAILNLTVLRDAKTAREALNANNDAMSKVLASMKESGIDDRDLQTGGFNIQPRYRYPDDKNGLKEPEITGYSVSNNLTVRIRDLNKVGNVLDTSVTLGVNQGGDISFVNDNPAATITEARKRAVADAIAKAKTLTDAAGVGLGKVVEITEQSRRPMPVPLARGKMMAMEASSASDSVPVAAGENNYNVSVNVTFEINQ
ncbi:SIMPL domain-containing protein [Paraburkholderia aspalathi]|nr:SIMPL domain-containing protein [Paraburkholderia aspalathi]